VKVATEIWDRLCGIRIPGQVRQVIDVVMRKTYGFNKKWDWIPLNQFCRFTGMPKNNVVRALRKAESMCLVLKKENGSGISYCFNKDYEQWRPLPKRGTGSPKRESRVPQKEKKRFPNRGTSIDNTKDTSSKDSNVEKDKIPYLEIISDLNEVLGTKYRDKTEETRQGIRRWWKQGFRIKDFKAVHRIKKEEWEGTEQAVYLRPSTLYGPKFENYLNQGLANPRKLEPGDVGYMP